MTCEVIKVIVTDLARRGCGKSDWMPCHIEHEHSPVRRVTQYYSLDGELLFEDDPVRGLSDDV